MESPPRGVSDHPARDKMEQLWSAGARGTDIYQWLRDEGLPLIKVSTISRYGQRYWNTSVVVDNPTSQELDQIFDEYEERGFRPSRVSLVSKDSFVWDTDEEGNRIQTKKDVISQTITFTPERATIAPSSSEASEILSRAELPNIKVPGRGKKNKKPNGLRLAVSVPDMQVGYYDDPVTGELHPTHDERAINVAMSIMAFMEEEHGIDLIVNQGDGLDLPSLSSHRTPPGYLTQRSLQASIDRYSTILATERAISKNSQIIDIPSNHGARLINTLIDKVPSLTGIRRSNSDEMVLSLPYLCRYDEIGVEMVDGGYPDGVFWAAPNLLFVHGHAISSTPGGTARKYLRDNVSVIHGHSHRCELLYRVVETDGVTRISFAGSPGTLARVDGVLPSFKTGADDSGKLAGVQRETWNQGIWFVWYDIEGIADPDLEICKIEEGQALFRGQRFSAEVDEFGRIAD